MNTFSFTACGTSLLRKKELLRANVVWRMHILAVIHPLGTLYTLKVLLIYCWPLYLSSMYSVYDILHIGETMASCDSSYSGDTNFKA